MVIVQLVLAQDAELLLVRSKCRRINIKIDFLVLWLSPEILIKLICQGCSALELRFLIHSPPVVGDFGDQVRRP